MKFEKLLKKLIKNLLPFSGDKTKIAGWILGLFGLQHLAGLDIGQIIALLASPEGGLTGGVGLLVVGLLDKYLKAKHPEN